MGSFSIVIALAILIYWGRVGVKFNQSMRSNGWLKFLSIFLICLVTIGIIGYSFLPPIGKNSPAFYMTPKGLLILVIGVVLMMIVPIAIEFWINHRENDKSETDVLDTP